MKNVGYYMLSMVLVLLFVTGMLLSAHAEGEDSIEETSAEQSAAFSSEEKESYVESSEENSSADSSQESETDSSAESSVESLPESSAESSAESSVESSAESSAESSVESSVESSAESSVESSAESSVESSAESSVESSAESSLESTEPSEESSHSVSSEPVESVPEEKLEPFEEESITGSRLAPNHDPLRFMQGISTVIPAQRPPQPSAVVEISSVVSWLDTSAGEGSYRDIENVPLEPVNETVPDAAAVQPPRFDKTRSFLIGIIIFSLIGMGLTIVVILLLKARGGFTPSFLRFEKKVSMPKQKRT